VKFNLRIATGWTVALAAFWIVLRFVFHVSHAWAWILVVVVAVGLNGYIATNLKGDG
jgi:hypothetical protein